MSFYIATTEAGQLLRVEGFALVSRDSEVIRRISDRHRTAWATSPVCVAAPLRTPTEIPPLPVNRDALLVHPQQLLFDHHTLLWEYIPFHQLSSRDQDIVSLVGTQLYITLDATQPATRERRLDMLGNETVELMHRNSLVPRSLPRIGFDQAHGSDSTGVTRVLIPRTLGDERQWPVGSPNKPLTPPVVVDLRARKVRIRRGDRDV